MRTVVIVFGLVCLMGAIRAQSVGIGTSNPDPKARLDVSDNQRGILIPRLTTAERNAITNPPRSLLIYNTTCNEYQYYIPGTGWVSLLTNVTSGPLTAFPATDIWTGGFTAHWSPVAGATGYEVKVYQDCGSSTEVATATFPAGSTSGSVSVSMPCNQTRCYEVRATFSSSGCGTAASLFISNRVPVTSNGKPCLPNTWASLPAPPNNIPMSKREVTIAHDGFIYVGFAAAIGGLIDCYMDWWRWDPCSGTWTQLSSLPVNLNREPIIFAIGSYIYVGGGECGNSGPFNSFYRYDPATNTWLQRANLPVPLSRAAGASDGTYGYVACGVTTGWTYSNTLYRYNPSTDSWTNLSTVPGGAGRMWPFMAYYQGKLYIGGGTPIVNKPFYRDFYVYDIQTNTWTRLADHPTPNYEGWAVAYNGKIYVTGERVYNCTNQFYYYNIASNSWSPMPVFPGGLRNRLQLAELNGVLYGGFGYQCLSGSPLPRDWWAFCP